MSANSKIEWTDHTFNPWWGCQKVSPGCANCYADSAATRYGFDVFGPPEHTERRRLSDRHWSQPERWNRSAEAAGEPAFVFCASMADVFEDNALHDERDRLLGLIERTPWLTWLLLTKRPQNVPGMTGVWADGWPPNVWLGTSVEDQQRANERVPVLLEVGAPAAARFLSCEPLLGPVTLLPDWLLGYDVVPDHAHGCGEGRCEYFGCPVATQVQTPAVDWVIVGGESGGGARPMQPDWARGIRDACAGTTAFFFKQWGAWAPDLPAETGMARVGKKAAGRELDGRIWSQRPARHHPALTTA